MRTILIALIAMVFAASSQAEERIFTNVKGKKIVGEVIGVSGERVQMTVSGKRYIFPINTLSVDDQAFIQQWAKENKTYKLAFRTQSKEDVSKRLKDGDRKNSKETASWRYDTEISNQSGSDLENLVVKYNVVLRQTETAKEQNVTGRQKKETPKIVSGSTKIDALENSKTFDFATDWLSTYDKKWEKKKLQAFRDEDGDIYHEPYWDEYTDSTELDGIWVRIYLDDRMISEWKSQGKLLKDARWVEPGR